MLIFQLYQSKGVSILVTIELKFVVIGDSIQM